MGKYVLRCLSCGRIHNGIPLRCDNNCDSLLRSEYSEKRFLPGKDRNIFKFSNWLPCEKTIKTGIGPVIMRPEKFSEYFKLKNLYCCFNGYWPEKSAFNMTATFKDFEALPTLLTFMENGRKRIILSSAGNTARAFAYATTLVDMDTYLVVPEKFMDRVWIPDENFSVGRIHLIAVKNSDDYYEAIKIGDQISKEKKIFPEGGAKNVARRDGMSTVMLEFARVMKKLPDHYFQAVGSGTGAIAAFEACLKILGDKKYKNNALTKLHLVQNAPFIPIYWSWEMKKQIMPDKNLKSQIEKIGKIHAKVLANRNPPYNICGGVKDVLTASKGSVYSVSNGEALKAAELFEKLEGVDVSPAASVCLGGLIQALKEKKINRESSILLNITGGGEKKLKKEHNCKRIKPEIFIDKKNINDIDRIL